MTVTVSSPASSGPAGSHFEGQVGAHYLLTMLAGAEPQGLPGTTIDRIELQRAGEGRPLDDVIIRAHDTRNGDPAVLEIQVKRTITFAPSDPVFRAVIGQIAKASVRQDFWVSRYELAIATARTSRNINGAYQDVLTWAHQFGDPETFIAQMDRSGSGNKDMRTFVRTFRSHLRDAGTPDDDKTVWAILRKLHILVFDFTAKDSASKELAKERAVHVLHPDDTQHTENLWTNLIELALRVAASGGDRTRDNLIEDIKLMPFRLAGDRRYSAVRATLAEDFRNALADIDNRVDNVILTRHVHIAAIHTALDTARYVEIRGDAGVGKSGVLKHFAEQIGREARVVLLSPSRTTPRGWAAMRAGLKFDGTAHDLLTDLASDGGAALFIDNLDFFDDEERRRTVVDLVREAAGVPGFIVITTARRNFGVEEENWLPVDAFNRLGRTEPIMIGELSETEVDELRHASPRLAPLLTNTHPARAVTRNLFRLARLASRSVDEPVPRTEVDMAEQWWKTADGKLDDDHRERARLLKALAEQALSVTGLFDVSNHPASSVDALVVSETLRDLGSDRVVFRHDVFREWAIANLLYSEPTKNERLPLDRPASAALTRGVELASRMILERSVDCTLWSSFLERLSQEGTHGSWRRAVLLALVRSEIGPELMTRASAPLLDNHARMLRELIRTVMAVDVESAPKLFAAAGIDLTTIPASINIQTINVPIGPSWVRLIGWLLSLGQTLPGAVIPDVVDLYTTWSSMASRYNDPLSPSLIQWLYTWLTEIEEYYEARIFRNRKVLFGGELDYDRIKDLESYLRSSFLMLCFRTPELAVEYLQTLGQRQHSENIVRSILKSSGSLAQAAPAELAELTANALIPKSRSDEQQRRRPLDGPFDFLDHKFYPPSPAQGPFFELLTHAPQYGLSLIHRLIDHAISFHSRGDDYGTNAFIILFPSGERVSPWTQSYAWSRGANDSSPCVTSALMALEAWAHGRIDAGENFDKVLADVLGPPGTPAAYLLVAVDLLLSHWPKSRAMAVPFIACPELLCLDRQRQMLDNFKSSDNRKEPAGTVSLDSLKKRTSRQSKLDELFGEYAVFGPPELRDTLNALLHDVMANLGPPNEQSDLGDPAFMAVHALNLINPQNWHEVPVTLTNGTQEMVHKYVAPESEKQHLAPLQEASQDKLMDTNIRAAISLALEDPRSRSSTKFAAQAVTWAQSETANSKNEDVDEAWMQEQAVVSTAMIVMRDGAPELRKQHEDWAHNTFAQALQAKEDPVHRIRSGLRYNPPAIAFAGMIYALMDRSTLDDWRSLLEVAACGNPATAHGFGAAAKNLDSIDERLPRAVLRGAFAASIRPSREWRLSEEETATRTERYLQRVQATIDAELEWLADKSPEPDWPEFPPQAVRKRRGIRIPGGQKQQDTLPTPHPPRPDTYADHQAAALWLKNAKGLFDVTQRPRIREIIKTYSAWTAEANGTGLDVHEDVDNTPDEWNDAYYDLLAHCLPDLALSEVEQLALAPISSLPDKPFFDVVSLFLRSMDIVYFNDSGLQESVAINIRTELANRLMASDGWQRLKGDRSTSIEIHIGPAIAAFFFNDHSWGQPAKCYLLPKGIDRIDPFLPILKKLVESCPSYFVAIVTLNLFEVTPRSQHLPLIVFATTTWLKNFPEESDFWVDNDIGRRVCVLIGKILSQAPTLLGTDQEVRSDVDWLLAAFVSLGVPEAKRLEEALAE